MSEIYFRNKMDRKLKAKQNDENVNGMNKERERFSLTL